MNLSRIEKEENEPGKGGRDFRTNLQGPMGLYKPLLLKKLPLSRDKLMQILTAYFRTWSAQKNALYEVPENVNFRVFGAASLKEGGSNVSSVLYARERCRQNCWVKV